MLFIIQNPMIVNRNSDFFYKTNRFESRIGMLYLSDLEVGSRSRANRFRARFGNNAHLVSAQITRGVTRWSAPARS